MRTLGWECGAAPGLSLQGIPGSPGNGGGCGGRAGWLHVGIGSMRESRLPGAPCPAAFPGISLGMLQGAGGAAIPKPRNSLEPGEQAGEAPGAHGAGAGKAPLPGFPGMGSRFSLASPLEQGGPGAAGVGLAGAAPGTLRSSGHVSGSIQAWNDGRDEPGQLRRERFHGREQIPGTGMGRRPQRPKQSPGSEQGQGRGGGSGIHPSGPDVPPGSRKAAPAFRSPVPSLTPAGPGSWGWIRGHGRTSSPGGRRERRGPVPAGSEPGKSRSLKHGKNSSGNSGQAADPKMSQEPQSAGSREWAGGGNGGRGKSRGLPSRRDRGGGSRVDIPGF